MTRDIIYDVTGDPNPDCNGYYLYGGEFGGSPYYIRQDSAYYIWVTQPGDIWTISTALGGTPAEWWSRLPGIEGMYAPNPPTAGNPTVTAH